jgi:hypothetical protein
VRAAIEEGEIASLQASRRRLGALAQNQGNRSSREDETLHCFTYHSTFDQQIMRT